MTLPHASDDHTIPEFLAGGGEMGQRIREYDWSSTSLGPVDQWPHSLRTCIRIMLTSRQPIWIGWGRELIKFYNDPYIAIVGGKHPHALGQPASIVWKDIWSDIEPMLRQVMEKDEGTYVESQLLIMERNGYPEETYYTFSYTPIPGDDGKTGGMFCANSDDTDKIISERQFKTLTLLGQQLADCKTNNEIIKKSLDTFSLNPQDFPFSVFRTINGNKAEIAYAVPGNDIKILPKEVSLTDDQNQQSIVFNRALETRRPQIFEDLIKNIGALPKGSWQVHPDKIIVIPVFQPANREPFGLLSVGLNPYRLPDENYLSFFALIADQIATSFAEVHILEEERKKAQALAELDRAKTIFFSNISHEFRTPLTLLMAPIEDLLNDPECKPEYKTNMQLAFRNAQRMQKLVNTLLDFSRLEAGKLQAKFIETNIAQFTSALTETFRPAVEAAGMQLITQFENINSPVFIDREMWEKIVLNLLSNALKYSTEGKIQVAIEQENERVRLTVSDTGFGIAESELNKIFDRFHRIDNMSGRSREGTGIGLAMVKELVKLHRGEISVKSELDKGSEFTVLMPRGKEHLPEDHIIYENDTFSNFTHATQLTREAMSWIPNAEIETNADNIADNNEKKYTVLIADDNADMRMYLESLLVKQFNVIVATDGEAAFEKLLETKPDLLISDIMMPKLDGFGLLQKVRAHSDTKNTPVIFLSARAGEEAKVEGLEAGADDYLVKPFSAKELTARVEGNIRIAKSRIASEYNLRNIILQSPVAMCIMRGPELVIEIANGKAVEVWGKLYDEVINKPAMEAFPELVDQGFAKILKDVYETGRPFVANEMPVSLIRNGKPETLYINFIYDALRNSEGVIDGIVTVGIEVSEQVRARKDIEQSEKDLNQLANAVPQLVWIADEAGNIVYYNDRVNEFAGAFRDDNGIWKWQGLLHEEDIEPTENAWQHALATGTVYQIEHRGILKDGSARWLLSRAYPHKDENGDIIKWFGTATDIQSAKEHATILEEEVRKRTAELKELNDSLQRSNHELQQFAHVASHDLKEPLRKIKTFINRLVTDDENRLTDKSKVFIQKTESASERMFTMIDGVLNYSVLNAGEQRIDSVDLSRIVNEICNDLELPISEKGIEIVCENLPVIEGAYVLLYQLFYNLVNNSLKFSRPDTEPVIKITAVTDVHKGITEITVADNGIGFEQEYAERIFKSFTRLNSKDKFEGTGLGLSLCKRIAERHGGTVTAHGKLNEGATFVIMLPIMQSKVTV